MRALVGVALALGVATAMPSMDAVHKHMEPPPPHPQRPFVRRTPGSHLPLRSGLLISAARLASPKRLLALLPATVVGASFFYPDFFRCVARA